MTRQEQKRIEREAAKIAKMVDQSIVAYTNGPRPSLNIKPKVGQSVMAYQEKEGMWFSVLKVEDGTFVGKLDSHPFDKNSKMIFGGNYRMAWTEIVKVF